MSGLLIYICQSLGYIHILNNGTHHERQILHQADRVALGRLGGAHLQGILSFLVEVILSIYAYVRFFPSLTFYTYTYNRLSHHAPVRVVELAGFGLLPLPAQRRVEPAQVRERGRVRQAVQDLFFWDGGLVGQSGGSGSGFGLFLEVIFCGWCGGKQVI